MTWAWLTLASALLNALWSSQIKSRVQKEGALTFALSMRWGVALGLLPFAFFALKPFSPRWWLLSGVGGSLECLSVWVMTKGIRKDYYSTYALSNTTPLFSAFWAVLFLKETIGPVLGMGVFLVVSGALWLYYRGHWSWWGLTAAFIGSVSGLLSKMALPESGYLVFSSISFMLGALVLTVVGMNQGHTSVKSVAKNVWVNKGLIVFSAVSTVVFYAALEIAPLSRVSTLVRANLIVGFLLSYFHLGETHGWRARGFGAILLLVGLALVLWKN